MQGAVGGQSIRFNPYIYAGANPVMYTDPDGEFFFLPILASFAFGALASGAINLVTQMAVEGCSWDYIDKTSLDAAMLEGGILGAIGGGIGSQLNVLVKAGQITKGMAVIRSLVANFGASTLSSMLFHQQSLGEALVSNAVSFGIGLGIGYAGGKLWLIVG